MAANGTNVARSGSDVAFCYFSTMDEERLARLKRAVAAQERVNRDHSGTNHGRRLLVCDRADALDATTASYFDEVHACDPYVVDAGGNRRFSFGRLRNLAVQVARASTFSWIYFCDADTVVVDSPVKDEYHPFCAPRVYWQRAKDEDVMDSVATVAREGDACFSDGNSWFIVKRDLFARFDFNERMYGYGFEDKDFFMRMHFNSIPLMTVPGVVVHLFHPPETREVVATEFSRNKVLFDADCALWTRRPDGDWKGSELLQATGPAGDATFVRYRHPDLLVEPSTGRMARPTEDGDALHVRWTDGDDVQTYRVTSKA